MLRYFNALIAMITLIATVYSKYSYTVSFLQDSEPQNPNPTTNKVRLIHGRYSTVKAKFVKLEGGEEEHSAGSLTLGKDLYTYVTAEPNYSYDTRISLIYSVELGISCGSPDPEIWQKIIFGASNLHVEVPPIEISFIKESFELNLTLINPKIPLGAFGILSTIIPIRVVDEMKIDFKINGADDGVDESVAVDTLVIPDYNGQAFTREIKTRFAFKKATDKKVRSFQIISGSESCIVGKEVYTIELIEGTISDVTQTLTTIVESTKQVATQKQGQLMVQMTIDFPYFESHCVMQETYADFISDSSIVNRTTPEGIYLRYFYRYHEKAGIVTMVFNDLAYYTSYKMKCIFNTISYVSPKNESLTFGYFNHTQVKVLLKPSRNPQVFVPTQCYTWKIGTPLHDRTEFIQKATSYCWSYLTDYSIPRESNGCLECEERNVTGLFPSDKTVEYFGYCIRTNRLCNSNYTGNLTQKAEQFMHTIDSGNKLKAVLNLDQDLYTVSAIYPDNDNVAPDKSRIHLENVAISKEKMTFSLYSDENKTIECYGLVTDKTIVKMSVYDFTTSYVLEFGNKSKVFEYVFNKPVEWDDRVYNLVFQCKNIPNCIYTTQLSDPFVALQFKHNEQNQKVANPSTPVDCSLGNNRYDIQCIPNERSNTPVLETPNPKKNNAVLLSEYKCLDSFNQSKKLNDTAQLSESDSIQVSLEKVITINSLLGLTYCPTYITFTECHENKKQKQTAIIELLNKKLGGSDIISNLQKTIGTETFNSNVLLALQSIFYSIDNGNTFTISSNDVLLNIMKNIYSNLPKILEEVKEAPVKRDIIRIIATYLSIYVDLSVVLEMQGYYNSMIINGTELINSKALSYQMEMASNITDQMLAQGIDSIDLERTLYEVRSLDNPAFSNRANYSQYQVMIDYPKTYLTSTLKAKSIAFVLYKESYPMRSFKNQFDSSTKAVSIRAYDGNKLLMKVENLPSSERFTLTFTEVVERNDTTNLCYAYQNLAFDRTGIESNRTSKGTLQCRSTHLTDFVYFPTTPSSALQWWVIFIIVLVCGGIVVVCGLAVYKKCSKKDGNYDRQVKELGTGGTARLMNNDDAREIN